MGKTVLVTGISGFAGSFLAEELLRRGYTVHGTYISEDIKNIERIKKELYLHKLNLLDYENVKKNVSSIKPDFVFHLAALTSPPQSFKEPGKVLTGNINSQMNLLESIRLANINPKILITSSAEVYGMVSPTDLPVDENVSFKPVSPYAVSKITQDFMGLQYFLSYRMSIIRVRPFNHIGPRQAPQFVVASFASQIAAIEKGKQEPILKVGNLDSKRDFTDVRDMVKAYIMVLEKGIDGEVYNIGFGESYRIKDILEKLISFSTHKILVELDPGKLRPSDIPDIYCNNSKIKNATGWEAEIPLETTLKDTIDYFRDNV